MTLFLVLRVGLRLHPAKLCLLISKPNGAITFLFDGFNASSVDFGRRDCLGWSSIRRTHSLRDRFGEHVRVRRSHGSDLGDHPRSAYSIVTQFGERIRRIGVLCLLRRMVHLNRIVAILQNMRRVSERTVGSILIGHPVANQVLNQVWILIVVGRVKQAIVWGRMVRVLLIVDVVVVRLGSVVLILGLIAEYVW